MSFARTAMIARSAVAPRLGALATKQTSQQILARVSQLGLSQRAFHSARLALQATAHTSTPAPKASHAAADSKHTAAESKASAAVATATASAHSFSEIVQRYGGWYPFLGLAGVIAVSKELLILNEEFLLVSNFAAMFATLYFTLGDTVTKAAEEQRAEIAKRTDDIADLEIEALTGLLQAHELNIEQVSVLQTLKKEHNTLSTQLVTAKELKVKHAARDAMVKRLGDLRSREMSERASFKEQISVRASAFVKREFTRAPAATKAALIDFAISVVEGKAKQLDSKQDPVKALYRNYFENKLYVKEIEAEKANK